MIAACKALLEAHSPYVRTLRHAVQTAGPLRFDLHLDQAVAGREVAAVVNPYNVHEVRCRKIVIAHKGKLRPDIVDILSPLYEPLQYPLFPFGDPGWSRGGSQLCKPPWSQCRWYRYRLLSKLRFLRFGRLTCEYLVDMYCRIEDERLQYLREGKTRQAREVFAAEGDTQEKDDYEMELQRAFAGVLPSSFLGSRAWTSKGLSHPRNTNLGPYITQPRVKIPAELQERTDGLFQELQSELSYLPTLSFLQPTSYE